MSALPLAGSAHARTADARSIGLFTTLPILWEERDDLRGLLNSDAPPHWARAVLQSHGDLRPLDRLMPEAGADPLRGLDLLVMAQPRPLSPQENVSLDGWVRRGGRVLLFADPMLTAESYFALGDKRRPQDVVLLSPILTRWGLRLRFREDQPAGERSVRLLGVSLPVNLPGIIAVAAGSRSCRSLGAVAARCRIGKGEVLVVADAALLENAEAGAIPDRRVALERLISAIESQISRSFREKS